MLVLTRRAGEEIVVNGNVVIKVVLIKGHDGEVRLGITAPPETTVFRREHFSDEDWVKISERAAAGRKKR